MAPLTKHSDEEVQTITRPRHLRSAKFLCRIDGSAFASILVVLLIMFMFPDMVMPVRDLHRVSVASAEAKHSIPMPGIDEDDALVIAIRNNGETYVDTRRVRTPEDLYAAISRRLQTRPVRNVYINADARAHYQAVAGVVAALHDAGIERVGLLTEQRRALPYQARD